MANLRIKDITIEKTEPTGTDYTVYDSPTETYKISHANETKYLAPKASPTFTGTVTTTGNIIVGDTSNSSFVTLNDSNGRNFRLCNGILGNEKFSIFDVTANSHRVAVDLNGNMGIANTSPSELLTLGTAGTTAGTLSLAGATSGKAIIAVPSTAGTPTLTLPTTSGELALTQTFEQGGYSFDGTDDYVSVADNDNIDFGTGDFTIEWYGVIKTVADLDRLFFKITIPSNVLGYDAFVRSDNKLYTRIGDGTNLVTSAGILITSWIGQSFHYVASYQRSGSLTVYINGVLRETTTISSVTGSISNTNPLIFGYNNASSYSDTKVHSVRIYNKALSSTEITDLYNRVMVGNYKLPYSLIGGYNNFYASNFSSGVDGWTSSNVTSESVDGISDGSTSKDDVLRVYANNVSAIHNISKSFYNIEGGKNIRIKFEYLIKSGNTNVEMIQIYNSVDTKFATTVGTWSQYNQIHSTLTYGLNFQGIRIALQRTDNATYTAVNNATDDVVYIKNLVIEVLGSTASYIPENANSSTWIDNSGNNLHGTTSGSPVCLTRNTNNLRIDALSDGNPTLGSELITNPTFAATAGWTGIDGTNWVHGTNLVTHGAGQTGTLTTTFTSTANNVYEILTSMTRTAGSITISCSNDTRTVTYSSAQTNGAFYFVPTTSASQTITITPTSDYAGNITQVSIKVLTPKTSALTIGTTTNANSVQMILQPTQAIAIGQNAGQYNKVYESIMIGYNVGRYNTTGRITILGFSAGQANSTGRLTAIGFAAGRANTTGSATCLGDYAGQANTTGTSTYIGDSAGYGTTTGVVTCVGFSAGYANTTGTITVIGYNAGFSNTTATITAIGHNAGFANTTGSGQIFIGSSAGRYAADGTTTNQTSSQSIYIGDLTKAKADGDTNEIVIGYNAIGSGSNTITLGNTSSTALYLFGHEAANGTWRFNLSGTSLLIEKRVGGSWVTKLTITE